MLGRTTRVATTLVLQLAFGTLPVSGQPWRPVRDNPAQRGEAATATARITGRVLDAATGQAVKRARVMLTAAELSRGRATLTDDSGTFDFTELPAGRFTVTASKAAYLAVSYGQRRPLQPGTPLQLGDGEQLKGIDVHLPHGSVIEGTVYNKDGDPLPGTAVGVMRY